VGRKWQNIKYSKGKADHERGAVFSACSKDIMKAAKDGGPDPEANFRLKVAIQRARTENMPNENIQRSIDRAMGAGEGRLEEVVYEGYGPGGVAVMLNIVTDNRNRTAADVRHAFTKGGGALGETGCVGWMFARRGQVIIDRSQTKATEDDVMMVALDAGADDVIADAETFEILTAPEALNEVLKALEAAKIPVESGETAMIPSTYTAIEGENAEKLMRMLEVLESHDDIQSVYHNAELPEE
jgi:YebC/PmpR family DNA-binding regulatory protein